VVDLLLLLILLTLLFGRDFTVALLLWIWDVNDIIGRVLAGTAIAVAIISGPIVIALAYATTAPINSLLGYTVPLLFGYAYVRFVAAAVQSFAEKNWESLTASQRISILKTRAETRRRKQKDGRMWSGKG